MINVPQEVIQIIRPTVTIGAGSIERPEPLQEGETLSKIFPHQGPTGGKHKGNMRIFSTSDHGFKGRAKCVAPSCKTIVGLEAVSE